VRAEDFLRTIHKTILFLLSGFVLFQAGFTQSPRQHEPLTQDLSQGATFKVMIAPDLMEFTFKMIPHVVKADESGNPQSTIEEVQVFRGDGPGAWQTLEGCQWAGMEVPPRGVEWLRAEDMNFDGYKDIYILTNWGATGFESGCIWLYDPASGKFVFSREFSELSTFQLDPQANTITTHGCGGMACAVFHAGKYVVENNRPVQIMEAAQDWDLGRKQFHCVVKHRRPHDAEWTVVRDQWAKPGKNDEGPCDPAEPFRGMSESSVLPAGVLVPHRCLQPRRSSRGQHGLGFPGLFSDDVHQEAAAVGNCAPGAALEVGGMGDAAERVIYVTDAS
jgi:hypothetical protein